MPFANFQTVGLKIVFSVIRATGNISTKVAFYDFSFFTGKSREDGPTDKQKDGPTAVRRLHNAHK